MKIGVTGCSHSSYLWGNPWHFYLSEEFKAEVIYTCSPGAGNEMNFEKMKYTIETYNVDYFIFQISDPSRLVMGINNWVNEHEINRNQMIPNLSINEQMTHGQIFRDLYFYTFNAHENEKNLEKIFEKKLPVDDFMINHVITSTYNIEYKVFMIMCATKFICDFYGIPLIFFSWFTDINELSKKVGYKNILEKMNIVPGCVIDFINENKIESIPNDGHYDGDSHLKIYREYLSPYIKTIIK